VAQQQKFRVGIIGCGKPWKTDGSTGFGMSHQHVIGYKQSPDCQLVALADISVENAKAFQQQHGGDALYTDYHEMLAKEKLDIVSIATWPKLHAPMVIDCASAKVRAVHCEKPMALTWGESRRMVEVCERNNVQLTFNHQRRFNEPFRKGRELLKGGAIGQLRRMEATCGNMYDWGTHWLDMLFFYNDQQPAEWVIGQIDTRGTREIFGAPCEGQGLCHFKFANNVRGLLVTGYQAEWEAQIRLIGTDGVIEIEPKGGGNVHLRVLRYGQGSWENIETSEGIHGNEPVARGVLDLIDALKTGREPELSGRKALMSTEVIFATYESSRRRGRVDLPLTIDDSPLIERLKEEPARV
jgi:UDP-N-acetylglucosamine 3-dehydrogenase